MTEILVVEDSEIDHAFIKQLFKRVGPRFGWNAEFAFNSGEALDRLEKHEFDLILTDFYMPEMNGMELMKRVHFLDVDIPVVIMSSQGCEKLALDSLRGGAANYVIKQRLASDLPRIISKLNSTVRANARTKLY